MDLNRAVLTSTQADYAHACKLFEGKAEVHNSDFKGLGWDDVIIYNFFSGLEFTYKD